jgi:type II secretory ATPase GspE/PulE/Tfp pilus assembly ATPase PilB-like protein
LVPGAEGGTIDELLADMDDARSTMGNDDSLESAAADNELVKFVNKVIIDAYNQKASDIHIEPMPGKAKTGIRFRIDGSLQPYIEVPSHFRQAMVTRLKIMCDLDISERASRRTARSSSRNTVRWTSSCAWPPFPRRAAWKMWSCVSWLRASPSRWKSWA